MSKYPALWQPSESHVSIKGGVIPRLLTTSRPLFILTLNFQIFQRPLLWEVVDITPLLELLSQCSAITSEVRGSNMNELRVGVSGSLLKAEWIDRFDSIHLSSFTDTDGVIPKARDDVAHPCAAVRRSERPPTTSPLQSDILWKIYNDF